jgi:hypothetical protein
VDVSKIPTLEKAWTRSLPDFTRRKAANRGGSFLR